MEIHNAWSKTDSNIIQYLSRYHSLRFTIFYISLQVELKIENIQFIAYKHLKSPYIYIFLTLGHRLIIGRAVANAGDYQSRRKMRTSTAC